MPMPAPQVHQQEVWEQTVKRVRDPASFDWQKQARFYWKQEKDTAMTSIADADTEYCYEYLGVKERLVVTPLTDRCYITLSQALAMYLGGAPAGPAGTGKTETTKVRDRDPNQPFLFLLRTALRGTTPRPA